MKTSKIKEVKRVSEPYGKFNTLYHHLVMENGDKIDIGKNKKQEVGMELTYEITGDVGQHQFTKAKSVNPNWQNNNNNFRDNLKKQIKIERWAGLTRSMAWFTLMNIKPESDEQIFAKALELIDWVNDEPKQTSVKTHLENMQKDIDDLPF
ncbi:MAG: hypothetical protein GOVbin2390_16 [Prokaryotic dsDNA virus sp.]|nr:MAG: hypothetical protein GOVbin2390_16 [Prokaryotic dsDNA virus sp.]|tara:strand:- start:1018 stop:1470 length:453 start_codon:yes stop_codon:yes gene_type:complete